MPSNCGSRTLHLQPHCMASRSIMLSRSFPADDLQTLINEEGGGASSTCRVSPLHNTWRRTQAKPGLPLRPSLGFELTSTSQFLLCVEARSTINHPLLPSSSPFGPCDSSPSQADLLETDGGRRTVKSINISIGTYNLLFSSPSQPPPFLLYSWC